MKKLIFILCAFMAISMTAQTTPTFKTVKLTTVPNGGGTDDVLTIGSSKTINKVTKSSLLSGLATTTYVDAADSTKAPIASPTFTGTVSGITKVMVGLGNVENTTDAAKPVSTATQTALNLKANIASPTFTGTVSGITKAMVGLGNVDNTTDAAKPVSTATQTALDAKQATLVSGTSIKTINGNSLLGSGNIAISGGGGTGSLEFDATDLTVWNNGMANKFGNLSFGQSALRSMSSFVGDFNTAIGNSALRDNFSGSSNTALGAGALIKNTSGEFNNSVGQGSLQDNLTGIHNVAFGYYSLNKNNSGNYNVAVGNYAGNANTNQGSNVFVGSSAGFNLNNGNSSVLVGNFVARGMTTGSSNTFVGSEAGSFLTVLNQTTMTNASNCVFIGAHARSGVDNSTNQIVIGHNTIGPGSNTVSIGNDQIVTTRLRGQVNMGSIKLDAMNTAPASATAAGTVGEIRVTATHIFVCIATDTWVRTALTTW